MYTIQIILFQKATLMYFRFLSVLDHIPKFVCSENCQNPEYHYSGAPIRDPPNDVMFIEDKLHYKVEWHIFTQDKNIDGLMIAVGRNVNLFQKVKAWFANTFSNGSNKIVTKRNHIGQDIRDTADGLVYWMKKGDIQFFGSFMKVILHIQAKPESQSNEWKIALNNTKGGEED